ncbi:hypothetical protein [Candidatus Absconditicoccus praedator]|uniref:hypothetical protein n=1 Tax=Candidatus Absconditicoccus praedator TaxID=2735562 RepID=UPI001E4BDB04|nr:hypothetical protein [Candidatus Absconditicoccus praedator]UFX83339.1 hypothetical protein HLG78_04390 [Candidatus Absconditicoccus praedator]
MEEQYKNFKQILVKKRCGATTEIGKFITFFMTTVIGVSFLSILAYYYYSYREETTVVSVLSDSRSTPQQLQGIGLCDSVGSGAGIEHEGIHNSYAVACGDNYEISNWDDFVNNYREISKLGEDPSWASSLSGDQIVEYAVHN